jgi:hypothetical protein
VWSAARPDSGRCILSTGAAGPSPPLTHNGRLWLMRPIGPEPTGCGQKRCNLSAITIPRFVTDRVGSNAVIRIFVGGGSKKLLASSPRRSGVRRDAQWRPERSMNRPAAATHRLNRPPLAYRSPKASQNQRRQHQDRQLVGSATRRRSACASLVCGVVMGCVWFRSRCVMQRSRDW